MLKSIACWIRGKKGNCRFNEIREMEENIRITELCLSKITNLKRLVNCCIDSNDIEEVLRFRTSYIDNLYWHEIKEGESKKKIKDGKIYGDYLGDDKSNCSLSIKECNKRYLSTAKKYSLLSLNLKYKVEKYNKELAIIKQVQNYCWNYAKGNKHTNKEVYFKFGRDKFNDLIALYFNVEHFLRADCFEPIETIFVFSGQGDCPFNHQTVLNLKYESNHLCLLGTRASNSDFYNEYHAHICDFTTNNGMKGHGTFILKNLEEIIKRVNSRILDLKTENQGDYYNRSPIRAINGEVIPGNIPRSVLIKFYNKNGLSTIDKIYEGNKYIEDAIIYRELEY